MFRLTVQSWCLTVTGSRGPAGVGNRLRGSGLLLLIAVLAVALLVGGLLGCSQEETSRRSAIRQKPGAERLWGDAAALQEILLESDVLVRAELLASELRSLAPSALEDVLSAYDAVFLDIGAFELELLAEWWAQFDPRAAFEWSQKSWRASHPLVAQAVLRVWAREDPAAALRAAERESRYSVRRSAVGAVLAGWEEGGTPGSLAYVESLPAGHDRQRYLTFVARRKVLREGVEAAIRWAESQPDEPHIYKLNLYRRIASAAGQVDPRRTAEWVESLYGTPLGDQLPQRLGTRWVARQPEAAMEWFEGLPPGFDRDMGLQETYRMWLRHDKEAARAWMAGRENAAWLDPARALYAMSIYREPDADPLPALQQALSIVDEQRRWATVGRIWRVWYFREPEAAEAWFLERQDEVPPFYRQRIPRIPSGMLKAGEVELPSFLEGNRDDLDHGEDGRARAEDLDLPEDS